GSEDVAETSVIGAIPFFEEAKASSNGRFGVFQERFRSVAVHHGFSNENADPFCLSGRERKIGRFFMNRGINCGGRGSIGGKSIEKLSCDLGGIIRICETRFFRVSVRVEPRQ